VVVHGLEAVGGVAGPADDFADDAERIAAAVAAGGVAGEFAVGEVRVVFQRAGGLDDVDAAGPVALGQLRAPDGGVQGGAQVDVGRRLPLAVVGGVARADQVAGPALAPWK
jgi:hypothetical protein